MSLMFQMLMIDTSQWTFQVFQKSVVEATKMNFFCCFCSKIPINHLSLSRCHDVPYCSVSLLTLDDEDIVPWSDIQLLQETPGMRI